MERFLNELLPLPSSVEKGGHAPHLEYARDVHSFTVRCNDIKHSSFADLVSLGNRMRGRFVSMSRSLTFRSGASRIRSCSRSLRQGATICNAFSNRRIPSWAALVFFCLFFRHSLVRHVSVSR